MCCSLYRNKAGATRANIVGQHVRCLTAENVGRQDGPTAVKRYRPKEIDSAMHDLFVKMQDPDHCLHQ